MLPNNVLRSIFRVPRSDRREVRVMKEGSLSHFPVNCFFLIPAQISQSQPVLLKVARVFPSTRGTWVCNIERSCMDRVSRAGSCIRDNYDVWSSLRKRKKLKRKRCEKS